MMRMRSSRSYVGEALELSENPSGAAMRRGRLLGPPTCADAASVEFVEPEREPCESVSFGEGPTEGGKKVKTTTKVFFPAEKPLFDGIHPFLQTSQFQSKKILKSNRRYKIGV